MEISVEKRRELAIFWHNWRLSCCPKGCRTSSKCLTFEQDIDGLVQNCITSIANALGLLQYCAKPLIYCSSNIFARYHGNSRIHHVTQVALTTGRHILAPLCFSITDYSHLASNKIPNHTSDIANSNAKTQMRWQSYCQIKYQNVIDIQIIISAYFYRRYVPIESVPLLGYLHVWVR